MAWCNNSLKAGKGKIMDCKNICLLTLPLIVWISAGLSLLSMLRDAAREGACAGRNPSSAARREGGGLAHGPSELHLLATIRLGKSKLHRALRDATSQMEAPHKPEGSTAQPPVEV